MRPLPAQRIGSGHGLLRALEQRGRLRADEFVTEFSESELFPPEAEPDTGRTRQYLSLLRATGLVQDERGSVELTDLGRRYVRSGDPDDVFAVSSGQAEWLRRALRERHLTDSVWHGAAIGLSLYGTLQPGEWVSLVDFGRAAANLGRTGWDNENTFRLQGERFTLLLQDMGLVGLDRQLTPAGEEMRQELRLPVHQGLVELAGQLNPGGPAGAAAAGHAEQVELGLTPTAATEVIAVTPAPAVAEPPSFDPPPPPPPAEPVAPAPPPAPPPAAPEPAEPAEPVASSPAPPPPPAEPVPAEAVASSPPPPPPPPAAPVPAEAVASSPPPPPPPPAAPVPAEPVASSPPPPPPPPAPPAAAPPLEPAPPVDVLAPPSVSPPPPAAPPPPAPPVAAPPPPPPPAPVHAEPPAPPPPPTPPAPAPPPAEAPIRPQTTEVLAVGPLRPTQALQSLRPEDLVAWRAEQPDDDAEEPFLSLSDVRSAAERRGLKLDDGVYAAAIAALGSGRHLVLTGGAGQGKTSLALALAEAAVRAGLCEGALLTNADPTTFDAGLVPVAIQAKQWLIADEVDRVELDAAFGSVSTILGGHPLDLQGGTLEPPPEWRTIATMGDLSGVAATSAALRRRFVFIEVPVLSREELEALVERWAEGDRTALAVGKRLIAINDVVELGPGLYADAVAYVRSRRRLAPADETSLTLEALAGFVLPQLEGLGEDVAARAVEAAGLVGASGP